MCGHIPPWRSIFLSIFAQILLVLFFLPLFSHHFLKFMYIFTPLKSIWYWKVKAYFCTFTHLKKRSEEWKPSGIPLCYLSPFSLLHRDSKLTPAGHYWGQLLAWDHIVLAVVGGASQGFQVSESFMEEGGDALDYERPSIWCPTLRESLSSVNI